MQNDHKTHRPHPADVPAIGILVLGLLGPTASAQTLQDLIDQASPGDTVRVEPGDYTRRVTVDRAITLMSRVPGTVRLAALAGSEATVVGITFDGALASKPATLVECDSDLRIVDCAFEGPGPRGVLVRTGAQDVVLAGCTFRLFIEAMALEPGAVSLTVEDSSVEDCILALTGQDTLSCEGGAEREPAGRCESGCGTVTLTRVLFTGGERHLAVGGDYLVRITGSRFERPAQRAVDAAGVRLEMDGTDLFSSGGSATGLRLESVSGFIRSCRMSAWDTALVVGDGGCPRYSDLVIGGSLEAANDLSGTVFLDLGQPEPVSADLNFWGSTNCSDVNFHIRGQTVARITDPFHLLTITCPSTPALPSTWGRIKARFVPPGEGGSR